MISLDPFLNAPLHVQIHAISALQALVLGAYVLNVRKGDRWHRILGYIWVVSMALAIGTSWFISGIAMFGPFSPIHLLSAYATYALIQAVRSARRGDVKAHRGTMRGLYFGGLITAGVLSFLPGRIFNRLLFSGIGEDQGFLLVLGAVLIAAGIYMNRTWPRRRRTN